MARGWLVDGSWMDTANSPNRSVEFPQTDPPFPPEWPRFGRKQSDFTSGTAQGPVSSVTVKTLAADICPAPHMYMSPAAQPGGRATEYGDIVKTKWTADQAELEQGGDTLLDIEGGPTCWAQRCAIYAGCGPRTGSRTSNLVAS